MNHLKKRISDQGRMESPEINLSCWHYSFKIIFREHCKIYMVYVAYWFYVCVIDLNTSTKKKYLHNRGK